MKTTDFEKIEKENQTGQNHEGPRTNFPVRYLTASSVIGDKIENKVGEHLGKIKDIMIDVRDGNVQYVVIEFGGFLGIGEKYFAVPFTELELKASKEEFILNRDKSFLEKAPGFDRDHWPLTNSHLNDVQAYWGSFMGPSTGATS